MCRPSRSASTGVGRSARQADQRGVASYAGGDAVRFQVFAERTRTDGPAP
jgi:hypothetical protein